MAKVNVERKGIEVTLTLNEDEALALMALTGQIEVGNQPLGGVYDALFKAVDKQVPDSYVYQVRTAPDGKHVGCLKVVKV